MMLCKLVYLFILFVNVSAGYLLNEDLTEITKSNKLISKFQEFLDGNATQISLSCAINLKEYVHGLILLRPWAFKMLDAGSKIPSGIMEGNIVDLGTFDECLNAEGTTAISTITGQYCIGTIPFGLKQSEIGSIFNPESGILIGEIDLGFRIATCLPSTCSAADVQQIYAKIIGSEILIFKDHLCQTKFPKPQVKDGRTATISFLAVILGIILLSTAYDIGIYYAKSKPVYPILIAFSALTNGQKIFATTRNISQISCMHGIRAISIMWVILGHRYVVQTMFPFRNSFETISVSSEGWFSDRANMFMIGASVSVDTFLLMSGSMVAYIYMTGVTKGSNFNIFMFYLHRYLRLTPIVAVVALIHVTLVRDLGSGPLWPTSVQYSLITPCENNWWKSLIYIQNTQDMEDMCIPQTWYLAVDTQLYLLSPLLLIPLKFKPKLTLVVTGFLTICSIISSFLTCWFLEFGPSPTNRSKEQQAKYMKFYYVATWVRGSTWLIGFILGYFIFKVKERKVKFIINKLLVLILWAIALAILSTCVFGGHGLYVGKYGRLPNALYLALLRPFWAVSVAWVIFACDTGYGGPVNGLLSLPIFEVISKLSFTLYVVHYTIMVVITGQIRQTPIVDNFSMMYAFWGDFMICFLAALIITLAFESPILAIEKILFGGKTIMKSSESTNYIAKSTEININPTATRL